MSKTKLSVSIDAALVKRVDRKAGGTNRSAIVERALVHWLRAERRRDLEAAIERHYQELSDAERDEDARWARASAAAIRRTWT